MGLLPAHLAAGYRHVCAGSGASEPPQQPAVIVIDIVESEGEHPCHVAAVQQRQVNPHTVGLLRLDHCHVQKCLASGGVAEALRFRRQQPDAGQWPQHPLAIVLQENADVPAAKLGRLLSDQRGDYLGGI